MAIGLPPLLLAGGASFLPSLIAGLFGSPQAKLRSQISRLTSPGNIGALTEQLFRQGLASPAFAQAQGAIRSGSNAMQGQLASRLGQAGIGASGTGAILQSAVPSITGGQFANLFSGLHQGAQSQAQQSIQAQIDALLGTQGPSTAAQLGGVGLQAFLPFLLQFLGVGGGGGVPNQVANMLANAQAGSPFSYSTAQYRPPRR